jgi:DNA polymerase III subunit beta
LSLSKEGVVKVGYLAESHQLLFSSKEILLVSQLIDGNFPDYTKIMPKEFDTQLSASREELLQAVKAAYIFARDNSNMMKWVVEQGKIVVTSTSPERGECNIELPATIDGPGGSIVFNAKFVMDYLSIVAGETIQFGMSSNLAPGMFWEGKDESGKYVVMPINV